MNFTLLTNRIILIATLVLIGFTAWFFSDIVAYVLIAAVIWFVLTPLVNFLDYTGYKGKSLPRWAATLLAMIIFMGVLIGLGSIFFPLVVEQASVLAEIDQDKLIQALTEPLGKFEDFLATHDVDMEEEIQNQVQTINIIDFFGDSLSSFVGLAGNLFIGFFAVCFISFFFLKDESLVKRIILGATPDRYMEKTANVLSNAKRLLSRYFLGLIIQVTLIATLVTIGMSILGVENAFLIGIFAGAINVIPYLGPVIGSAFGMFMVFTTQIESGIDGETGVLLLMALGVFVIVQTLDNILFQPFIFANSVNAHPLEIFLIIFIAGKLGGVVGMISAIPAYTLIRIIAKEFLTQFKVVQNLTKNI